MIGYRGVTIELIGAFYPLKRIVLVNQMNLYQ
jgi:hypothetical protein